MTRPGGGPRHPAEMVTIGVHAGRTRFRCDECEDDLVVVMVTGDDVVAAWETFAHEHAECSTG